MSTKMKAAQISKAGGDWELVERDIPEPGSGHKCWKKRTPVNQRIII